MDTSLTDIELFAGGGGMAVGLRAAGFSPGRFHELNAICCETLTRNIEGKTPTLVGTVLRGGAETVDWTSFAGKVRLLAGGAPCQPFSLGGKHHAQRDPRNLFPEVLRAVRETRPCAVLLENVRGIVRTSFRPYFDYVMRQLRFPSLAPKALENWIDHNRRLQNVELREDAEYNVSFRLFDAADFGVPQNRLRVFVVATRSEFPPYVFPKRTHSRGALEDALGRKEYWDRHGLKRKKLPFANPRLNLADEPLLPWKTVRDGLAKLPAAAPTEQDAEMNHWAIPGARSYVGHTGSNFDWPAKTVKAGVHGVPGGENTIVDDAGRLRYFTLREIARLQTIPDAHIFAGTKSHVTRQIGNAVPSHLAAVIARPLFDHVLRQPVTSGAR